MDHITTLTLGKHQMDVLLTLLEFHKDDEPNEFYPYEPFKELCEKCGIPVSYDNI